MEQFLAAKNVFITGAGANIGRAIALEMAAHGARIYFADQDASASAAVEEELRVQNAFGRAWVCDISRPGAIEEVLEDLAREQITIDILVNNVGITPPPCKTVSPQSFSEWQRVMDTNVLAPLYLARAFGARMIEGKIEGSIVFITSIHQWVFHGNEVYSASKAGLGMMIDELAVSLAPHGIRVNGIAPGYCREQPDGTPFPSSGTPLRHESVLPCYIGRAAVFLCSDYFSRHTTGAVLKVDGGLSLYSFNSRDIISPPLPESFPLLRSAVRRARKWKQSLDPRVSNS